MDMNHNLSNFTQKETAAAIQIWNRAAVSLLDIRHNLISPAEALRGYRLPASAFLYTSGRAEVSLDDTVYSSRRFGLFHGGKGTQLTLSPADKWLEYYIVLYKAGEPPFQKREYAKLLEHTNPFHQQYGFAPKNPLFFADQSKKMFERWKGSTPLSMFYGKADFYQFVCGVYKELEQGNVNIFEPDVVSMAVRFFKANYHEDIAIQELCATLGVSYSHFHRLFKRKTAMSPQEYLIHTRLNAARAFLQNSTASIREIAEHCGFIDESSFYRLFMKKEKLPPGRYREISQSPGRDSTIEKVLPFPYNEESQVSIGELKGKGATYMFKQMSGKAIVAAALSLMMLMSACGTAPANTGGEGSEPAVTTSQAVETEAAEEGTRIVSTVMGDVEVPVNPQRIACYTWTGDLLSIGVVPVACDLVNFGSVKDLLSESSYWHPRITSSEEELMAANPDLIIVRSEEEYNTFGKIAYTIVVPYETSIEDRMNLFGEVFNKEEEAHQAVDAFYTKVEQYKEDLKSVGIYGKSIALVRPTEDGVFVYGDDWGFGAQLLYTMMDFKIPDIVQTEIIDTGEGVRQVSWEVAATYLEADYIEMIFLSENEEAERAYIKENEVWNTINAVKNENLVEFSVNMYDSKSLYVLDKLLDYYHEQFLNLAK